MCVPTGTSTPIFRVSPGNPGNCSIQLESEGEWPTLNGRLTAKEQDMELMVEILRIFGLFMCVDKMVLLLSLRSFTPMLWSCFVVIRRGLWWKILIIDI